MPHDMRYDPELRIIETAYHGAIKLQEILETFQEAMQLVTQHNCRLTLGDYRNAHVQLTTLEIHQLPKLVARLMAPRGVQPYNLKRAFVVAQDLADFHFFETVTVNNGQDAQVFQSQEEARKWLLQE